MEFDIFFSMMAHENIEFLEFQFQNLRSSFKDKKVLIIIHFNNIFWSELSKELSQLCLKYTDNQIVIKINPNHFKTEWGSSSGFDGLVSNLQLGHEYGHTFRYFLFYSSSELFIKSGLIDFLDSLGPFDMFEFNYKKQEQHLGKWDRYPSNLNDTGLLRFIKDYNIEPFPGVEWRRILTYDITLWLSMIISNYWSIPITPPIYNYPMSEWTISTILSVKPGIKIIDTIEIAQLLNRYPGVLESTFILKSCPRYFYHPIIGRVIKECSLRPYVKKVPTFYLTLLNMSENSISYTKNGDIYPTICLCETNNSPTYLIFQNSNINVYIQSLFNENIFIKAIQYLVDSNAISNDHWFILIRGLHKLGSNTLAKIQELLAEFEDTNIDILWLSSNKRNGICMVRREALIKGFDESVHQCCYEKDAIINENGKLYFESIDIETDS